MAGQPQLYSVAWYCPPSGRKALDLCRLGTVTVNSCIIGCNYSAKQLSAALSASQSSKLKQGPQRNGAASALVVACDRCRHHADSATDMTGDGGKPHTYRPTTMQKHCFEWPTTTLACSLRTQETYTARDLAPTPQALAVSISRNKCTRPFQPANKKHPCLCL